ncbi:MAG: sigma-54-dependent Fis family transcriptional regulator [Oryzomonas sp.]|uniref:sigma-54-dependent Fis family transcriptional regulator n=1 Tax=Oryzomonas sp. TaxID=2855186 RepID=UPI00284E46AC|nr:sigma-54-dependent Fis family transcriptional regulator [Oryzomonas sp.]MDR3578493.1 sigma-54-dependent Fis family transcriptional regulator [Oryzomonas sp.]
MNPRALVVDDELSIQRLLKIFLSQEGFVVDCASNSLEVDSFIQTGRYDLVLLDIHLGNGENGLQILRHLRDHDEQAHIALITGRPDFETATEALRLGAFDYLMKPLYPHQVISTAKRALRSKALIEENRRKQANLDAIFRCATEAIILIDNENRLIQANEAAFKSCGYAAEHINTPIQSIQTGCTGACRQKLVSVLISGTPCHLRRLECSRDDGSKRILSFNATTVVDNDGIVSGAAAFIRDDTQLEYLEKQVSRKNEYAGIIGKDSSMQRMFSLIDALANVQTTVLINGESGTGKEMVAAALHHQGARSKRPFVKVNCSALSEHLLESELFGHVRGAFTGAIADKTGRFQKADGGTILLDEIGDISLAMQMRLLRVLQEHEFEKVGDANPIKVDVRVIAATNQDLAEKVRMGTFRQDLYYRLNVIRLVIPPLRDRKDDIPLLVEHFLNKFSQKFNRPVCTAAQEAMELLMRYSWPGNVRELEHVIEYATVFSSSTIITEKNLPQDLIVSLLHNRTDEVRPPMVQNIMSIEAALEKAGGNKAKAARLLGLSRSTLYRMLHDPPP